MTNLNEIKFEIIVKTIDKLTEEQIYEVLHDFKGRLEGYYTQCPKSLINSDLEIKYINTQLEQYYK